MGIEWLLAALALVGHAAFWLGFICRLHATGWPCQLLKAIDWVWLFLVAMVPLVAGVCWLSGDWSFWGAGPDAAAGAWWPAVAFRAYAWFCVGFAGIALAWGLRERIAYAPLAPQSNHTQSIDLEPRLAEPASDHALASWLLRLPLNESLRIDVNVKTLHLPALPAELDGLSIVHLSDLHLTGKLRPCFYREVVRLANELDGDLVAITGDLVENADCLVWLPGTLGELKARYGVFYILGNHDRRLPDSEELRRRLAELQWVDVSQAWQQVAVGRGTVLLAGNELPWFPHAADVRSAPPSRTASPAGLFRILLSHSPDQIEWARERQFDLQLAGHTHGGQVLLPLLGPLVTPSWYGTRYASGLFDESPTLLHVSRGVAALHPFRYQAPPEITKLVLRRAAI